MSKFLSMGFLVATIGTTFYKGNLKNDLLNELTEEEIKIYKEITEERRRIYLQGLGIGLLLSYLYLKLRPQEDTYVNGIITLGITGSINYFYYILTPKKKYMLEYLDSKKENKAWLKIYKTMQFRWHISFILGLLTSFFIKDL